MKDLDSKFRCLPRHAPVFCKSYEKLTNELKGTSKEITVNYKEQMVNIKSMVATYFAKIDT